MKGLSLFFLNDYGNNCYPVFSMKIDRVNYNHLLAVEQKKFIASARIRTDITYFNLRAGFWEPFLEGL
jgi:hypothetical protein